MRRMKNRRGAAAVEFALVLPILVVLALGICEFSLVLFNQAVITNASREGARAGIVARSPRVSVSEITNVVTNYCSDFLVTFGAQADPGVTVTSGGTNFSDPLTVTVTYTYGFLALPGFVTELTGPLNLTATTVMRME